MKTHTLLMPLDMHLHLRDGVMLENIAPLKEGDLSVWAVAIISKEDVLGTSWQNDPSVPVVV